VHPAPLLDFRGLPVHTSSLPTVAVWVCGKCWPACVHYSRQGLERRIRARRQGWGLSGRALRLTHGQRTLMRRSLVGTLVIANVAITSIITKYAIPAMALTGMAMTDLLLWHAKPILHASIPIGTCQPSGISVLLRGGYRPNGRASRAN